MKQMHWSTFQTQYPDKAANYPGGEQAYNQQYIDRQNQWNQQGGGPRGQTSLLTQDPFGIKGFGEQVTGFGETLGGYKEQMGGFGEQLGGFGEQLGGFKGQFEKIDSRLQNMEQGITSLKDKFGVQQQQPQNPFQGLSSMFFGGGGYGNPYSGYSYF
jgi:hypothetical protein